MIIQYLQDMCNDFRKNSFGKKTKINVEGID